GGRGGSAINRPRVSVGPTARMLLVGTRGDPATPYRWTIETARRLGPSAVVLDNRGDGHTGYTSSRCVHGKVDDFLLYGTLPADGSSCPADGDTSGASPSG
ncbi:alpha/beta hydrolase, partial [Streptomyces sp. NPDC127079]|uniref:alpha/beta hydrolase n=1 Tax=Streptomyces sp. NPDC127079 TaxID=3347132 RepID=UPI003659B671